MREECAKYRAIVENATNADKVVKEKYNAHRQAIELLSKSDVSRRVLFL
jgi:programmed cell death 6-interacting protein